MAFSARLLQSSSYMLRFTVTESSWVDGGSLCPAVYEVLVHVGSITLPFELLGDVLAVGHESGLLFGRCVKDFRLR